MDRVQGSQDREFPDRRHAPGSRHWSRRVGRVPAIVVLAAVFVAAGCAQPTSPAGTNDGGVAIAPSAPPANAPVDVALIDSNGANGPMSLVPFVDSAPAGDVTFRVKNLGTIEHEMIVLKTDTPFDQLPVADARRSARARDHRREQGRRERTASARPATPTSNPAKLGPSPSPV